MPYRIVPDPGGGYNIIKRSNGKKVAHVKTKKDGGIYAWKAEGGDKKNKK
jgi:hypothetical protein